MSVDNEKNIKIEFTLCTTTITPEKEDLNLNEVYTSIEKNNSNINMTYSQMGSTIPIPFNTQCPICLNVGWMTFKDLNSCSECKHELKCMGPSNKRDYFVNLRLLTFYIYEQKRKQTVIHDPKIQKIHEIINATSFDSAKIQEFIEITGIPINDTIEAEELFDYLTNHIYDESLVNLNDMEYSYNNILPDDKMDEKSKIVILSQIKIKTLIFDRDKLKEDLETDYILNFDESKDILTICGKLDTMPGIHSSEPDIDSIQTQFIKLAYEVEQAENLKEILKTKPTQETVDKLELTEKDKDNILNDYDKFLKDLDVNINQITAEKDKLQTEMETAMEKHAQNIDSNSLNKLNPLTLYKRLKENYKINLEKDEIYISNPYGYLRTEIKLKEVDILPGPVSQKASTKLGKTNSIDIYKQNNNGTKTIIRIYASSTIIINNDLCTFIPTIESFINSKDERTITFTNDSTSQTLNNISKTLKDIIPYVNSKLSKLSNLENISKYSLNFTGKFVIPNIDPIYILSPNIDLFSKIEMILNRCKEKLEIERDDVQKRELMKMFDTKSLLKVSYENNKYIFELVSDSKIKIIKLFIYQSLNFSIWVKDIIKDNKELMLKLMRLILNSILDIIIIKDYLIIDLPKKEDWTQMFINDEYLNSENFGSMTGRPRKENRPNPNIYSGICDPKKIVSKQGKIIPSNQHYTPDCVNFNSKLQAEILEYITPNNTNQEDSSYPKLELDIEKFEKPDIRGLSKNKYYEYCYKKDSKDGCESNYKVYIDMGSDIPMYNNPSKPNTTYALFTNDGYSSWEEVIVDKSSLTPMKDSKGKITAGKKLEPYITVTKVSDPQKPITINIDNLIRNSRFIPSFKLLDNIEKLAKTSPIQYKTEMNIITEYRTCLINNIMKNRKNRKIKLFTKLFTKQDIDSININTEFYINESEVFSFNNTDLKIKMKTLLNDESLINIKLNNSDNTKVLYLKKNIIPPVNKTFMCYFLTNKKDTFKLAPTTKSYTVGEDAVIKGKGGIRINRYVKLKFTEDDNLEFIEYGPNDYSVDDYQINIEETIINIFTQKDDVYFKDIKDELLSKISNIYNDILINSNRDTLIKCIKKSKRLN